MRLPLNLIRNNEIFTFANVRVFLRLVNMQTLYQESNMKFSQGKVPRKGGRAKAHPRSIFGAHLT